MVGEVNWIHGENHMRDRHGVTVTEADEALSDPDAVLLRPDPASTSGASDRVIGWSPTARALLTVVLVRHIDGVTYGANGWKSNPTDHRRYQEGRA
ncbi:transposase [Gordonia westfalica]|uniref:Transposase n=1 Tax=Gordonia westfalica TaxID=158898 RepID=A0ABU2GY41_9ACTN|nr:transposase [Gordonia westfalica]MDS1116022.1 transposase [Gordonia westfalica]